MNYDWETFKSTPKILLENLIRKKKKTPEEIKENYPSIYENTRKFRAFLRSKDENIFKIHTTTGLHQ